VVGFLEECANLSVMNVTMHQRSQLALAFVFGLAFAVGAAPMLASRYSDMIPLRRQMRTRNRELLPSVDQTPVGQTFAGCLDIPAADQTREEFAAFLRYAAMPLWREARSIAASGAAIGLFCVALAQPKFSASAPVPLRC
jgi:hypothetical protein